MTTKGAIYSSLPPVPSLQSICLHFKICFMSPISVSISSSTQNLSVNIQDPAPVNSIELQLRTTMGLVHLTQRINYYSLLEILLCQESGLRSFTRQYRGQHIIYQPESLTWWCIGGGGGGMGIFLSEIYTHLAFINKCF